MAGPKIREAEIPWCATCLVLGTIACHTCVLVGNLKTSSAMLDIGRSTGGWSNVGLGLARAFQEELDGLMANVSADLIDIIGKVSSVTDELDSVVSVIGKATDAAVAEGHNTFLLQQQNISGSISTITNFMRPLVMNVVSNVVKTVTTKVNDLLDKIWLKAKPVLLQIGVWLTSFGNKITGGMEAFSTSLDKVQKIFDQIMAQLNGSGGGASEMLEQTFGLIDVDGSGRVSSQDLRIVAELYSINALAGTKPEELVQTYDHDGDGEIDKGELKLLVSDPSVPNLMSTVLRQFAKKLTEVSGQLARETMRDKIALAIVGYFQLVCAQNHTKVGWVSDAMTNGSIPLDFTSALMAQLCLTDGSPESLTTANIGEMVHVEMYRLHPDGVVAAFNNMANTTYWELNGFNVLDQPRCIAKVGGWIHTAQDSVVQSAMSLLSVDAKEVVKARVASAHVNTQRHLHQKECQRRQRHQALFSGKTSQMLLLHLTGGTSATAAASSSNPLATQAMNSGQPALPATLQFAAWLSNNASGTVDTLQELSFSYASTSSNKLDTFATQIQGMIKKATGFINMMMKFSTTAGIDVLDRVIHDFMRTTESDILNIVHNKIDELIDQTAPLLGDALDNALDTVTDRIGDQVAHLIDTPLESAINSPLQGIAQKVLGNGSLGATMSGRLSGMISGTLSNKTSEMLEDQLRPLLDSLMTRALDGITASLPTQSSISTLAISKQLTEAKRRPASLLEVGSSVGYVERLDLDVSGNWQTLVSQLGQLNNVLPAATTTLKNVRTEIMKAAANLDSIFTSFGSKGPSIFNLISKLWTLIWVLYFLFFVPLMLFNLYYAWWASGWFGGPKPAPESDGAVAPRSWWDRFRICCGTCGTCMTQLHDTQCCFWSMVIFMQVIVLVLFVISIALCVVAGVKAFVTAGCAQVYLLGDALSCQETISTLRSFVHSFYVGHALEVLGNVCPENSLMTCALISAKMKTSIMLTTAFSFLATILSLEVIIETAIMHEQARYRRLFTKMVLDEQEEEQTSFRP